MKKNKYSAFTLIELMIVIAIIAMLLIGTNFMSFNNLTNKQKLNTKIVKINSQIEKIINNSLLGRGIGTDLVVPEKYKIDFSTIGSGNIKYSYYSGAISDYVDYNLFNKKINFSGKSEIISKIICSNFDSTNTGKLDINETGSIIIKGSKMNINWNGAQNCSDNQKILELHIKRKLDTKKIQINTLNGLIKVVK